jgi:predicted alpha/beta superfamily hydrolase
MRPSLKLFGLLSTCLLALAFAGCGDAPGAQDTLQQAAAPSRWVFVSSFPSGTSYSSYGLATRNLRIYLPEDYWTNTTERYRVIYMHDGQNLFDASEAAFGTEWQVDENYDALRAAGAIEKCIFVGIWNTAARMDEYATQTTQATAYKNLIINSIKPYVDTNFRTRPEPQYTGIAGSSLGGLVSSWIAWNNPAVFGMAGNVSPSYWYENTAFYNTLIAYSGGKKAIKEWHYAGSSEGSNMATYATDVHNKLLAQGWTSGTDAALMITTGGQHSEYYWAQQTDDMLRFLIPAAAPSGSITLRMLKDVGYGNALFFTGNQASLTSWGTGVQGTWSTGSYWSVTLPNPGTQLEFKVRKGTYGGTGSTWESGANHVIASPVSGQTYTVTFQGGF